jgi:hypothetical protein
LQRSDVKIKRIDSTMFDKEIDLGKHLSFGLADNLHGGENRVLTRGPDGQKSDEDRSVVPEGA